MSTLLVEVCEVAAVERHPHADRLGIATVKGWKTAVGFDPATNQYEFAPGERCIYFPPDSVLPPALANSPYKVCKNKSCKAYNKTPSQLSPAQQAKDDRCALCGAEVQWRDGSPGRTGAMAFCAELPRDLRGVRPPAHPAFHVYTDIEHLANFPGVIADGEEVIFTEKLHGKNCRLGLVLANDAAGTPQWTWMAGSHGQRRKETFATVRRFDAKELVEQLVLQSPEVSVGHVFAYDGGKFWRVVDIKHTGDAIHLHAEEVFKTGVGGYEVRTRRSEFWEPMTENVRALLTHVRDEHPWPEPKQGIVLFGESYGTQDMKYGLKSERGFRAFDLAINGRYLDFDVKKSLCERFGVEIVPILYRGPFSVPLVEQHTDGPTVMCKPEEAGAFGGREGIVVTPAGERIADVMMPTSTNGRVILKSVSADYLARKGGTDAH